ncbi:MAG: aminoacetone oxidase family FAD-binding enzyme [Planctomycetaceae bacterium]|nr:aminoacetone oxidase family FAD-binding enzyme [Planctomycetaceae bacterium]
MKRIVVMGAGPAGLAAAIFAARCGADVRVLERNDQPGKKLLVTGGGHCNVTNALPLSGWPAGFGRRGRFITPALNRLPHATLGEWFAALGQPLTCRDGRHYFPESNSAKAVRDALVAEAKNLGIRIETSRRVTGIAVRDGAVAAVTVGEEEIPCDAAIVTGGGKSYPGTGSTFDGAVMAERLGHRVSPACPGLVGLQTPDLPDTLAGIVLPDALLRFREKGAKAIEGRGELLLTHTGISGPAVLDLSATVAAALGMGETRVAIAWTAGVETADWLARLDGWRRQRGDRPIATLLRDALPGRLARYLCERSGLSETVIAAALPGAARDRLATNLGAFSARISATDGWDRAMITRGGVDVRDVDPKTMASRIVPGLYFAGEVLDVDGPCGGYNLHWAFASGALAGESASR